MADGPDTHDVDPLETREWLESIDAVLRVHGPVRAHFLLDRLIDHARRSGAWLPFKASTAYVNTIHVSREKPYPGDRAIERRIESLIRWNAVAMVVHANRVSSEYGGHIATYASSATLYEVGFNHFWRAPSEHHRGDMIFAQGHSSPGIYARAYLEGRLTEEQLRHFRQEVGGKGLPSYPHPWLMPDFWQFPTVSMGLGPLQAIMQARFVRYLENRGLVEPSDQKVWCFLGDGEMDEPESMGALTMPVREKLDNLVFVINCNLQRLDGPVRGNGKIIQELEAAFLGAGWNVIKVIWGYRWDPLLARDTSGQLRQRMDEAVDGEYQNFKAKGGAYTREHFFGKYPELLELVANMSDDEIALLNRGGHDSLKVWNAYAAAMTHKGRPTVILAKTVKGYGMGKAGEALNVTHQQKKMDEAALKAFRDRFNIPISDDGDRARAVPPARRRHARNAVPEDAPQGARRLAAGAAHECAAARDPGARGVQEPARRHRGPRDFDHDGFRADPHAAPQGQEHRPARRADRAGRGADFRHGGPVPAGRHLFIGRPAVHAAGRRPADVLPRGQERPDARGRHQRSRRLLLVDGGGDGLREPRNQHDSDVHLLFDVRLPAHRRLRVGGGRHAARGFLIGATAGRTTLAGEGLQHQDGHSHLLASTIPNCISYDPCFAYELAVIMQDGLRRMYAEQESVFYYITCMNENYAHPAMPKGVEQGILRGMYLLHIGGRGAVRATLLGSGTILREVLAAAELLESEFGIPADVMSVTSFSELRRDALAAEREAMLKPGDKPRQPWVRECLAGRQGPFIAATDYMKVVSDQVRQWVPGRYVTLGTDGFGRSDARAALRGHFEVDRHWIVVAALKALADDGRIDRSSVTLAIKKFGIDPDKPDPQVS